MGCIARTGCLIVLVCLAIGAWITRDRWMHKITGTPAVTSTAPGWEPLTPAAGAEGKRKLDDLAKPSGPVFTNLSASQVASYVFQTVARTIPASADSAEAAVIGDACTCGPWCPYETLRAPACWAPWRDCSTIGSACSSVAPSA